VGRASDGISIRSYEPKDREGFARLVSTVLREFGLTVDPVLEADLDDPQRVYGAVLVATDNDEVIGSVAIRVIGEGATAELKRMYLQPAYRGRGLGRSLLDQAIGWAHSQRCRSIVLDTSTAMTAAQRLYQAAGFLRTGTRTETGTHDSRCEILYKLELSNRSQDRTAGYGWTKNTGCQPLSRQWLGRPAKARPRPPKDAGGR
jgi:ribosomal protein S18 acetylase RimI-like enzyme